MPYAQLETEQLRVFLAVAETGSVTGGARRIRRSQSAASLQIRHLEEVVGRPLFTRHGRGVALTAEGERLLPVARRVTQALEATLADLRGEGLKGGLRLGLPDDHSRSALADIVADFADRHPEVELQVHCALGAGFEAALLSGALDLAVYETPAPRPEEEVLRRDDLVWMRRSDKDFADAEILPVALFDRDCWWRQSALATLDQAGRRYRVVFTSESAAGVRAAVRAGVAAGFLNVTDDVDGLAPLPDVAERRASYLVMRAARGARGPVRDAMSDAIRHAFDRNGRPS